MLCLIAAVILSMAETGCEARLLPLGKSDTETLVRRNEATIKLFSETKLTVQKTCRNFSELMLVYYD